MEQSESYQKVERRIKEMEHQLSMSDHAIQACEQSGERRGKRDEQVDDINTNHKGG